MYSSESDQGENRRGQRTRLWSRLKKGKQTPQHATFATERRLEPGGSPILSVLATSSPCPTTTDCSRLSAVRNDTGAEGRTRYDGTKERQKHTKHTKRRAEQLSTPPVDAKSSWQAPSPTFYRQSDIATSTNIRGCSCWKLDRRCCWADGLMLQRQPRSQQNNAATDAEEENAGHLPRLAAMSEHSEPSRNRLYPSVNSA